MGDLRDSGEGEDGEGGRTRRVRRMRLGGGSSAYLSPMGRVRVEAALLRKQAAVHAISSQP